MSGRGLAAAVLASFALGCGAETPLPLASAYPSAQELARAVLQGFERRDTNVLRRLALTEAEFREHVWPGLPASRPERNMPFSYIWGDLRQKSAQSLAESLARYGGRPLVLVSVDYEGPTTRYGETSVHRDTVLMVAGGDGQTVRLRLYGSTFEQQGRFKVFSYVVAD